VRRALLLAGPCALLLGSCAQIGLHPRPVHIPHGEVVTTTGVRYADLFVGMGPAAIMGDELVLDYTVWLEEGARVDSTLDRGVPITVRLGEAPVKGLDDGLLGMQPKGRRRIVIPPKLAYGSRGVEDMIPPDATLVYEVHVLEVRRPEGG